MENMNNYKNMNPNNYNNTAQTQKNVYLLFKNFCSFYIIIYYNNY